MNRQLSFVIAGAIIGIFIGSSMGIAAGGTAYNAAFLFGPLGAFIGWLIGAQDEDKNEKTNSVKKEAAVVKPTDHKYEPKNPLASLVFSAMSILAALWNFHIDLLGYLKVLPYFVDMPIFFIGLCLIVTVLFPPFFPLYFAAWLSANHFGLRVENQFRAIIK